MIGTPRIRALILATGAAAILCNCAGLRGPSVAAARQSAFSPIPEPAMEGDARELLALQERLSTELRSFQRVAAEASTSHDELGYFSNLQHERLESGWIKLSDLDGRISAIASRYEFYGAAQAGAEGNAPSARRRAALIGLFAERLSAIGGSRMVRILQRDSRLVGKFNEAFLKAGEPRGGYDRLFDQVTASAGHQRRKKEWQGHSRLVREDYGGGTVFATLATRSPALHRESLSIRKEIISAEYRVLPKVSNALHHTSLAAWLRSNQMEIADAMRTARGVVMTGFGNLPLPDAGLTEFTPAQARQLKVWLRPGDVLLSYSGGYASNLVLPGYFKHAFSYVGDRRERRRAGLGPKRLPNLGEPGLSLLRRNLDQDVVRTQNGAQRADVIEAIVTEGVILNSLDYLLETHATTLAALRPRISVEERRAYLLREFSFLGADYDFFFDFNDASSLCCTELLYRALNHRGKIEFPLVKRAGYFNMNADAIVQTHYATPDAFELVFLAVQDEKTGRARLLRGTEANAEIRRLVAPE